MYTQVDAGRSGYTRVDAGRREYMRVDAGRSGYTRIDAGRTGCTWVDAGARRLLNFAVFLKPVCKAIPNNKTAGLTNDALFFNLQCNNRLTIRVHQLFN